MFAVAISALHTDIEQEAAALSVDLGLTPYEARLTLAAGTPAIVLVTPDRPRALDCVARLHARGQGAVACDVGAIMPSEQMTSLRRFHLEIDGLTLGDRPDTLPYTDIMALVRATHPAPSGERTQVLYLFRRVGGPPWILRETGADYTSLGSRRAATRTENFRVTVNLLRSLAPSAVYDERLLAVRSVPEVRSSAGGPGFSASTESGTDLLAHVVALTIARDERQAAR